VRGQGEEGAARVQVADGAQQPQPRDAQPRRRREQRQDRKALEVRHVDHGRRRRCAPVATLLCRKLLLPPEAPPPLLKNLQQLLRDRKLRLCVPG
jgi:hypothetical protein